MLGQKLTRKAIRFFIRTFLTHRLPRPYLYEPGVGWWAPVPRHRHLASRPTAEAPSPLLVYEEGQALFPHAAPEGMLAGGCAHCGDKVYFVPRDKTDPNKNGRSYVFTLSRRLYQRYQRTHAFSLTSPDAKPNNYRARNSNPQALRDDVAYALQLGRGYRSWIEGYVPTLAGLKVLELGPGINFSPSLYLACHGARPAVADRFLAPWDPAYHLPLYTLLRDRLRQEEPQLDLRPLDGVIAANGYPESILMRRECSTEKLDFADNSFDLVFSNAVFEHLWDTAQSIGQLFRITRPGGWGFHQVDFRFHPDANHPLEHLLLSRDEFQAMFTASNGDAGTCLRPVEMQRLFETTGFTTAFAGNLAISPAYLQSFLHRLRAAAASPYQSFSAEDLHDISGLFRVQKPVAP